MYSVSLLILSCFFFAVLAALIKFLSQQIHPFEQAFFRNFIGVLIILPFILKYKITISKKENLKLLLLRGVFGGLTMILLFWSYSLIPLSQAMAISFTTPLFMYLGSLIFFKEKALKINTIAITLGFILTIILIRPDLEVKFGVLIALIASLTHAIAGLLVKQISKTESVLLLMFSMVLIMTPISFFPSLYVWTTPNGLEIIILLIMIACIASIGNFLWTKALSEEALTSLMPFEFTKLLFATILGVLFFNEKLDLITIFSGIGLLFLNHYLAKNIKKNEKT
tara:strand:- start:52 stop:897 length:846 start_codon:yes stop_codon:yes gene_type:complete